MYRQTKSQSWPYVQQNEDGDEGHSAGAGTKRAVIRSLVIVLVVEVVAAIGIPAFFGTQAGADRQVQPAVHAHSTPATIPAAGQYGPLTVPGDLHGAIMENGHLPALGSTTTTVPR